MKLPYNFKTADFNISVISSEGSSDIGYLRLENKSGEYVGSFDCGESRIKLRVLYDVLGKMIKQSEKK